MLSIVRLSEENQTKVSREEEFVMKRTSNVRAGLRELIKMCESVPPSAFCYMEGFNGTGLSSDVICLRDERVAPERSARPSIYDFEN